MLNEPKSRGGIHCENIAFAFSPEEYVFRELSLVIHQGEFIGIVGANGTGKTTLVKLLNGSLASNTGHVFIDGVSTRDDSHTIRKRVIALFSDAENQLVTPTVYEELVFPLQVMNLPYPEIQRIVEDALIMFDLSRYRDFHPFALSQGEQFRLLIAVAWVRQPAYLILDEVLSALDSTNRFTILNLLKKWRTERAVALVLITHRLEDLYEVDRIIVLHHGKIVADGKAREIFDRAIQETGWGIEVPLAYQLHHHLTRLGIEGYPEIGNALPPHLR